METRGFLTLMHTIHKEESKNCRFVFEESNSTCKFADTFNCAIQLGLHEVINP